MFNWTENVTFPKISDVLNVSDVPMNFMGIFIEPWILFMGGWFFAAFFGAVGASLYLKYDNAMVAVAFFILMFSLCNSIFLVDPTGYIPSASIFLYIVGLLATFAVGFLLYQFFVSKKE